MKAKLAILVTLVCASFTGTGTAFADGPRQHRGFYLRMAIGPGYMTAKSNSPDLKISGPGGSFDFGIGGALTENFVLFGNITGDSSENSKFEINGNDTNTDNEAVLLGIGPGIAYYFMPVNLYLSGSVLFTQIAINDDDDAQTEYGTDEGFGMAFMVGKEWWVSANWGLGLAGKFMFGVKMGDEGNSEFNGIGFGVLFSATYN